MWLSLGSAKNKSSPTWRQENKELSPSWRQKKYRTGYNVETKENSTKHFSTAWRQRKKKEICTRHKQNITTIRLGTTQGQKYATTINKKIVSDV